MGWDGVGASDSEWASQRRTRSLEEWQSKKRREFMALVRIAVYLSPPISSVASAASQLDTTSRSRSTGIVRACRLQLRSSLRSPLPRLRIRIRRQRRRKQRIVVVLRRIAGGEFGVNEFGRLLVQQSAGGDVVEVDGPADEEGVCDFGGGDFVGLEINMKVSPGCGR